MMKAIVLAILALAVCAFALPASICFNDAEYCDAKFNLTLLSDGGFTNIAYYYATAPPSCYSASQSPAYGTTFSENQKALK